MEVFRNTFSYIDYDVDKQLVQQVWLPDSDLMGDNDYYTMQNQLVDILEKYPYKYLLVNSLHMNFIIHPALQSWTAEHIGPRFVASGMKAMAFVVPKEFMADISLKQTLDDTPDPKGRRNPTPTRFFPSVKTAVNWLLTVVK